MAKLLTKWFLLVPTKHGFAAEWHEGALPVAVSGGGLECNTAVEVSDKSLIFKAAPAKVTFYWY